MSKIEEEGFLSSEADAGKIYIYAKYADFFEFAKEVNKLCMRLLTSLKIDFQNQHKLIVLTLFLRAVENFQGVYLMLERGMMPQAKVLTRSMLETMFTLVALQKQPELLKAYLDQHDEAHIRSLKSALKFKDKNLRENVNKHGIEKLYIKKKAELKNKELKPLSPKEWSDKAKLEDFYNMYYVTYSNSTHSNLSALDDHIDESPGELNLSAGPSDRDLYDVLKCGVHILINAANSTELVNGNDISKELDSYVARFDEFDKKYI